MIDWSSNGVKRLYTSAFIVAGLAVALALRLLTVWIFDVIVLFVICFAVWDIMKATKSDSRGVAAYYVYAYMLIAYLTFLLGVLQTFAFWLHVLMQAIVLGIFAFYTFIMNYMDKDFNKQAILKKTTPTRAAAKSVVEFLKIAGYPFAMLFALIPLNHMGTWATVVRIEGADPVNVPLVGMFALLLVFVISAFTDTFAYLTGRALKGPKLFPKKFQYISPKKTIAGAVGGLFGGVVGALLVVLVCVMDGSLLQIFLTNRIGGTVAVQFAFVAIGLAGSIVTQLGDLYASWTKRRAGIKDFGNYLPGHGGAMDRLDGHAWNAVFIFFTFMLLVFI